MQNNIEMKNIAVNPRPNEQSNPNLVLPRLLRVQKQKLQSPLFTREEMRQIVAEQID